MNYYSQRFKWIILQWNQLLQFLFMSHCKVYSVKKIMKVICEYSTLESLQKSCACCSPSFLKILKIEVKNYKKVEGLPMNISYSFQLMLFRNSSKLQKIFSITRYKSYAKFDYTKAKHKKLLYKNPFCL